MVEGDLCVFSLLIHDSLDTPGTHSLATATLLKTLRINTTCVYNGSARRQVDGEPRRETIFTWQSL